MNMVVTSKEAILSACRKLVAEQGLAAVNMRAVAQECGVALGSLYNYFASKEDLVTQTIESVWRDIFSMDSCNEPARCFVDEVDWIFASVQQGAQRYPNFFTTHSISFASGAKSNARDTMEQYFAHMKSGLLQVLQADGAVRKNAFDTKFTPPDFVDFVLMNLLLALVQGKTDCGVLLCAIRRTIY